MGMSKFVHLFFILQFMEQLQGSMPWVGPLVDRISWTTTPGNESLVFRSHESRRWSHKETMLGEYKAQMTYTKLLCPTCNSWYGCGENGTQYGLQMMYRKK
jgi:hypothetical protein